MLGGIGQPVGPFVQERTVNLIGIPQQNDLCVFTRPGDNPLDLIGRGILRLIDDQIRLDDGASADEVERLRLDQPREKISSILS